MTDGGAMDMHAPVDSGVDTGAMPDLGNTDSGATTHELYGPCTADSDCPGTGAVCRRNVDGWPEGYCTVPCTDRTPCDDGVSYNHCIDDGTGTHHSFCERRCANGIDCGRDGYTCEGTYPPSGGRCIPVCSTDMQCGSGASCQPETALCVATGTAAPTGAEMGAACTADADCKSHHCTPETIRGQPTGNVHGACFGNCVLPSGYNPSTVFSGSDLPQGSCQTGEVCIPATTDSATGSLGVCLHACSSNADCRTAEGYVCAQDFGMGIHFGVGFCRTGDCTMTGCPTGYACQMTPGGNICVMM